MKKYPSETEQDLEMIRKKIEEEQIQAPEGLSQERMMEKILSVSEEASKTCSGEAGGNGSLRTGNLQEEKHSRDEIHAQVAGNSRKIRRLNRRLYPLIAAAACVAVIVIAGTSANRMRSGESGLSVQKDATAKTDPAVQEDTAETDAAPADWPEELIRFSDYEEIEKLMNERLPEEDVEYTVIDGIRSFVKGQENGAADQEIADAEETVGANAAAGDAAGSAAEKSASLTTEQASGKADHSETYEQVEGVSEADIIKTDGSYIYYVDEESYAVHIVAAKNGKTKEVSTITDNQSFMYFNDLYVSGNRLAAVGMAGNDETGEDAATVIVYDITDRANPKQEMVYRQSGSTLSSRMIGNNLYLITSDYIYDRNGRIVPYATSGGVYQKLPASNICACPEFDRTSYIVAGAVDITSGEKGKTCTRAVLGGSETIYCNLENLYVTATEYQNYGYVKNDENIKNDENTDHTFILRMELKDGQIAVRAAGRVPGTVNNQFSMDERGGYLRIATTSWKNNYDVNNVYVLDQKLNRVGSVTGFAKTEQIKAVRFIGEKAYVITYEQTDPLFVLDLSDPKKPVMEGHVKISGFSTFLVPADEKTLLGFGFSTETTAFGEATNGLKLVTFDVSDSAKPRVADSISFAGYESGIQYDHRALIYNEKKGYYAIPFTDYSEDTIRYDDGSDTEGQGISSGVLILSVTGDQKIDLIKRFRAEEEVSRCVFIGNWIYALQPWSNTFSAFQL